jgi:hypothetical protein
MGKRALALMGLSPGSDAASECAVWSGQSSLSALSDHAFLVFVIVWVEADDAEDLFSIVDKASKNVEESFSMYYASELQTRMKRDPAKKPPGWKSPAGATSKSGSKPPSKTSGATPAAPTTAKPASASSASAPAPAASESTASAPAAQTSGAAPVAPAAP